MSAAHIKIAKVSLTGNRSNNQDRSVVLSQGDSTLLCVADGLGGHPRGEVAAQLAIDVAESLFRTEAKPLATPREFMTRCVQQAHEAILAYGTRQSPPIYPRTTLVVALAQGQTAQWVHVGDSRLYLIRDGRVLLHTKDHSQVHFYRDTPGGKLYSRTAITRCLGGEADPPEPTAGEPTRLQPGDLLLLCSDGLWSQLPQDRMVGTLGSEGTLEDILSRLAGKAQERGKPHSDNVTLAAMRWLGETASKAQADENDSAAGGLFRRALKTDTLS